jgi:hypothetical protein
MSVATSGTSRTRIVIGIAVAVAGTAARRRAAPARRPLRGVAVEDPGAAVDVREARPAQAMTYRNDLEAGEQVRA